MEAVLGAVLYRAPLQQRHAQELPITREFLATFCAHTTPRRRAAWSLGRTYQDFASPYATSCALAAPPHIHVLGPSGGCLPDTPRASGLLLLTTHLDEW